MNLYLIKVWGPCDSEQEVRLRLDNDCDSIACVTAPSKSVANQMCYIISTRNDKAKPNHQEIIQIASPQPFVIGYNVDVFPFTQDAVKKMQDTPVLTRSSELYDAVVKPAYSLYQVNFSPVKKPELKDDFWIHAESKETARDIFYNFFEGIGFAKNIRNGLSATVTEVIDPCVFWKPPIHYPD